MSLNSIPALAGQGGANSVEVAAAVRELQRMRISLVDGAGAATKINLAAIRQEDTILAVEEHTISGGNVTGIVDQTANATISSTKASGTLTVASVNDGDVCVVDGDTYTFKDTPTALNHAKRTAGNNNANATALAATINAYQLRYRDNGALAATTSAVANSAVVTVTAVVDGTAGNAIVLTGTPTRLAASGSGTLAGGTATGGIVIVGATTGSRIRVTWFDKR